MEIERIRKELNELLENIVEHSNRYSDERPIPSLEISFTLTKVNKLQERMSVLRHLLEQKENETKQSKNTEKEITAVVEEAPEIEVDVVIKESEPTQEAPEEKAPTSENLEAPSITKLVDALSLNDRYLYANELFNKDMNAFNELVKSIDNCNSLGEALAFFSFNDLDEENEHVLSFQNLVERRFA